MKTKIRYMGADRWCWMCSSRGWDTSSQQYTRRHDAIRGLARFLERVRAK